MYGDNFSVKKEKMKKKLLLLCCLFMVTTFSSARGDMCRTFVEWVDNCARNPDCSIEFMLQLAEIAIGAGCY